VAGNGRLGDDTVAGNGRLGDDTVAGNGRLGDDTVAGNGRLGDDTDMTDVVVPLTTRKDWTSDQEVRWCPGCGDYSILAAVQMLLPELDVRRETTVFVSGIGCAARFPYYMNTYGMHSIHGRAPAVATGLAVTRPDLDVWVITGDGDSLSIGGNHLIHVLRRNVNLTMLLFNNQIYGLTKGQYSPTSEQGKVTKSTPFGSLESPFNPISLALGAEATFVARTHDMDRKHMQETFRRAHAHKGAAFVEVYQNCNVFNDGAFEQVTGRDQRSEMLVPLEHGQPIRFGADNQRGVVADREGKVRVVEVADVGEDALLVHDEGRDDPGLAFQLSRLSRGPYEPTPIGVFRAVERPHYGAAMQEQLEEARKRSGPGDLEALLRSAGTWTVSEAGTVS
jgi:2-oxoglutarate ferredoxin oxidoreductase subunit beta